MIGAVKDVRGRLIAWYRRHRRQLPWRVPLNSPAGRRPDPYHVLVSETMLQQTQVATVIPYYLQFLQEFPTIRDLAEADEQHVLRLWQGLGYYSRAGNLLRAARVVVDQFDGKVPRRLEQLRELPGIGRYTAGAISSLAFDRRAAIVDGNAARVLCRIDAIQADPREKPTQDRLWRRAEQILPTKDVSDFNSAMMELGATVCTSKAPMCPSCPIKAHCEAFTRGLQQQIPRPRKTIARALLRRRTFCIPRLNGRGVEWLIEQRPARGRWAGMWQFITRPGSPRQSDPWVVRRKLATLSHTLTHRRYRFDVYVCDVYADPTIASDPTRQRRFRWVALDDLDAYPLPRPHLRIANLLRECNDPVLPISASHLADVPHDGRH